MPKRVCKICGRQWISYVPHELYCPDCKGAAAEAKRVRENERKREAYRTRRIMPKKPKSDIREKNREMRDKGLTYGGKPVVSQNTGWPKFLREVDKTWKRSSSG